MKNVQYPKDWLEHQHDHRLVVFVHQYGEHDVMLKFSNDLQGCTIPLL